MTNIEIIETIEFLSELNDTIHEQVDNDGDYEYQEPLLSFVIEDGVFMIYFINYCIWESENDNRPYETIDEDESDTRIPLREHVINEVNTIVNRISSIKLS